MKSRAFFALPVLLAGCVASSAKPAVNPDPLPVSQPMSPGKAFDYQTASKRAEESAALVEAQNAFGARLVERLEGDNSKHENLIVSPTSLRAAISSASGKN